MPTCIGFSLPCACKLLWLQTLLSHCLECTVLFLQWSDWLSALHWHAPRFAFKQPESRFHTFWLFPVAQLLFALVLLWQAKSMLLTSASGFESLYVLQKSYLSTTCCPAQITIMIWSQVFGAWLEKVHLTAASALSVTSFLHLHLRIASLEDR